MSETTVLLAHTLFWSLESTDHLPLRRKSGSTLRATWSILAVASPAFGHDWPRSLVTPRQFPDFFNLPVRSAFALMAPNLALSQHLAIRDMILSKSEGDKSLTNKEIARAANCSTRSVRRIRSNLLFFGSTKAPPNGGGRPKSISLLMLTALLEKLASEPSLRLEDMAAFLNDEFEADVTRFSVGRALKAAGWSRKSTHNVAQERNARLRDEYMHEISCMRSDQLVFIDETGVDRSIGTRNKGWAPRGSRPRQVKRFHRGRRVQILPAYAQDGVVHFQAYTGSTDAQVFTEFIEQLLPY
ncbi:transcriptional regulator family: Helix-turn-helix [Purpureocillium lilacinum]|uniref:Transcriptional regulator family: Helix-turn-helix n=1 Tax=Purpureocillium lilacinum TaxID=33203 RepID=A0ABR0BDN6_PURLI|nr:transcriptional regulator family: Helix-turn-helix [Purpureocillium lilacinum]